MAVQANNTYGGKLPVSNAEYSGAHGNPSDSEFYPYSIAITGVPARLATDDNPGITETYPYIYASKRKYNGATKS
jgi:hypothetical protein